jgi:hypothetical protein
MKLWNKALLAASFVVLPLVSHASDNSPVTRAQVRADLVAAEQNGTFPFSKEHYPDPAWDPSAVYVANKAAQKMAREAANNGANGTNAANGTNGADARAVSSYGGSSAGSSAWGTRLDSAELGRAHPDNLYRHH